MAFPLLFPKPQRNFKGQRWVRISIRTLHIISMAFLLGGVAQGISFSELHLSLLATIGSGLLFVALELYCTFIWLFQLKAWVVILKMILMVAAGFSPQAALELFLAAIIIGSISSHMPGKYRYYSFWHGREIKE